GLERVAGLRDDERPRLRRAALLRDVRQLVCEQPLAGARAGLVLAPREVDVAARGEGARRDGVRERVRRFVRVDVNVFERVAEARAEAIARARVERAPTTTRAREYVVHVRVRASVRQNAGALTGDPAEGLVADRRSQSLRRAEILGQTLLLPGGMTVAQ